MDNHDYARWKHLLDQNPKKFMELMKRHQITIPNTTTIADLPVETRGSIGTYLTRDSDLMNYLNATATRHSRVDPTDMGFMKQRYQNMTKEEKDQRLWEVLRSMRKDENIKQKKSRALTDLGARLFSLNDAIRDDHLESLHDMIKNGHLDLNDAYQMGYIARASVNVVKYVSTFMNKDQINGPVGRHMLIVAAGDEGNVDVVEFLLEIMSHDAINSADQDGNTALHHALGSYDWLDSKGKSDHRKIARMLLNKMSRDAIKRKNRKNISAKELVISIFGKK